MSGPATHKHTGECAGRSPHRGFHGGLASRRRSGRRRGFSLLELLVVLAIAGAFLAVVMPFLAGMVRGTRVNMSARRVEAAMQYNSVLARKLTRPDFDTASPRIPNAHYAGTAIVFDEVAHKAWFAFNDQSAVFDPSKQPSPTNSIEWMPDPDAAGSTRKAYVRLRGDDVEHMDLQENLVYFGVAWDSAKQTLTLVPAPFVICASATGGSLPLRTFLDVDLVATDPTNNQPLYTQAKGYPHGGFDNPNYPLSSSGQRRVPTVLPWVLVVARTSAGNIGWSTDWSPATWPTGAGFNAKWSDFKAQIPNATGSADDSGRIQALINQAHAEFVNTAINGGTEVNL